MADKDKFRQGVLIFMLILAVALLVGHHTIGFIETLKVIGEVVGISIIFLILSNLLDKLTEGTTADWSHGGGPPTNDYERDNDWHGHN
jgi:hypothetical protein